MENENDALVNIMPLSLTEDQQRQAMRIVYRIATCDEAEGNHIVLGNPGQLADDASALSREIGLIR